MSAILVTGPPGCDKTVLASIMLSPHPFADTVKSGDDVLLINLTPENRDSALSETVTALGKMLR